VEPAKTKAKTTSPSMTGYTTPREGEINSKVCRRLGENKIMEMQKIMDV